MYKLIVFLCLSSFCVTIFGQIHLKGTCDLKMNDFIDYTILGDWYELKRINEKNSVQGSCVSLNFFINSTTGETKFTTTSVSNKQKVSRNASIVLQSQNKFLHIVYTDGIQYNMVIQNTDNLNYFIVHGCNENNNTKSVYGQVYTRAIVVPQAVEAQINAALRANTDFANVTWLEDSHSREACRTSSGMNLRLSSFLLTLIGLVLAKDI